MRIEELCRTTMDRHRLTQTELAARIGMSKQNLTHVLHGRRDLPAEAAFKLARLAEADAEAVYYAGKRQKPTGLGKAAAAIIAATIGLSAAIVPNDSIANPSETSRFQNRRKPWWFNYLRRFAFV